MDRLYHKLAVLYGEARAPAIFDRLMKIVGPVQPSATLPALSLSEQDVILITYGDQVYRPGEAPLFTLHDLLSRTVRSLINTVHLLPFYPYSSDDGFSVIDYYAVNPALGGWKHIHALHGDFRLMFDAVFNHVSVQSAWFQAFLRGEAPYTDYFITVEPDADLSQVVRPRALPLLTRFETARGAKDVWTTFSADQVDLNVSNPDVLLDLIRVLLYYVRQGADLIRLDAIAFLWKRIGTTCLHLQETHLVVQLLRDVLDLVAPHVILITETNVPHAENISYFGDGSNEAQMVYQFPLPPLTLHAFHSGDARALTRWAATLPPAGLRTTFFNFTASHDGIGVRPALGLLTDAEIADLLRRTEVHGGFVSYKNNSDGSQSPYELNITYFDAINDPVLTAAQPDVAVARFVASQAIALALVGVPGIYFHSLFGSRNDLAGAARTGQKRSINREKLDADRLLAELADERSLRRRVFTRYADLLRVRVHEQAFHPLGGQTVLDVHPAVFAVQRTSPDGRACVIALHNVGAETLSVDAPAGESGAWRDLLGGGRYRAGPGGVLRLALAPYQVAWLKAE